MVGSPGPTAKGQSPLDDRAVRVARSFTYVALFSLAFMRPQIKVGGLAAVPTDPLMAVAGLAWLVALVRHRRWPRWHQLFALLLAYFAVMVVSAAFAAPPFAHFLPKLASEAYLLALPPLLLGLVDTPARLRIAMVSWIAGTATVIVVGAAALAVGAIAPHLAVLAPVQHHLGSLPLGGLVRYRLFYENPNMLGAYLTLSLAAVLLALHEGWIARRGGIALVVGIGGVMIATFSAGIGGALLLAAVWGWIAWRDARPRLATGLLAAGLLVALAFVVAQAVTPVSYPDPLFAWRVPGTGLLLEPASRLRVWIDATHTFLAHPLTGVGIGMDVAHVHFVEPGGAHPLLRDGHNVLLNLAAGCGALGLVAILAILVALVRLTLPLRAARNDARWPVLALGLGVLDVLAYQGIGGGFEDARFVWAGIGLLLAAARLAAPSAAAARPIR